MRLIQAGTWKQYKNMKRVYKSSFPSCEKKPFRLIKKKQGEQLSDMWYIEENDEFAGIAITMNSGELVLLDYFAIAPEHRGQGYGSKALALLKEQYRDRKFFLEIESTLTSQPAVNMDDRKKRKAFYLRNGMSELGITAEVFGTEMELLGDGCTLEFEEYRSVYNDVYGEWAAGNVVMHKH